MTEQSVLVASGEEIAVVTAEPPPRRRKLPNLRRWISPIVLVLLWQLASSTGVLPPSKLSAPWTILGTARSLIADGQLGDAFVCRCAGWPSGSRSAGDRRCPRRDRRAVEVGRRAGRSAGADAADVAVPRVDSVVHSVVRIGETPKIALITLGVAFPLYVNVHAGIRIPIPG